VFKGGDKTKNIEIGTRLSVAAATFENSNVCIGGIKTSYIPEYAFNTLVGMGATSSSMYSTSIGYMSSCTSGGVAIGPNTISNGAGNITIGAYSQTTGSGGITIGYNVINDTNDSIIIGGENHTKITLGCLQFVSDGDGKKLKIKNLNSNTEVSLNLSSVIAQ
jgi:hypothetical protein